MPKQKTKIDLEAIAQEEATNILWAVGDLSYKLWDQQIAIYLRVKSLPPHVQQIVFLCARQYGKSVLGVLLACEDCLANPDVVVMIIGPSIKHAREIVTPRMRMICKDAPEGTVKFHKSKDYWEFDNGSELRLGGFDTTSGTTRGKTLYKIYIEEILESSPDTFLDYLRSDLVPALTHSKNAQIYYLTTLPKIPDHPFVTDIIPQADMDGVYFVYTIDDNKKIDETKKKEIIKLCGGENSVEYRREYLCEQVRDHSLVLVPEFDDKIHVKEIELPEFFKLWVGGDTGGVRDLTVYLLFAFDFLRAKVLVLDERWFPPETPSKYMIDGLRDMENMGLDDTQLKPRIEGRYIDADGQTRVDTMLFHNLPAALPRKDELEATVNQVRIEIFRDNVIISPKCKLLISTLRSGTFNKNKTDLERTKALGHCDAFMALAYGLRHAIKDNPYPKHKGMNPVVHYVDESVPERRGNTQAYRDMFKIF